MITVPKWKLALIILLAFLMGWQFAPQFAAASWYRPGTTILTILLFLGYWLYRGKTSKDQWTLGAMPEDESRTMAGYIDRLSKKLSKNRL